MIEHELIKIFEIIFSKLKLIMNINFQNISFSDIIAVIGIIVTIFMFSYNVWSTYYKHKPKLVVEIEKAKGITKTQNYMGLSSKNHGTPDVPDEMWYNYRFDWNFELIVRNNSEFNAYKVRLLQHKDKPKIKFNGKINMQKSLIAHDEINLPFQIHEYVECQGKNRKHYFEKDPDFFNNLSIVFEYQNSKGIKSQSRYYFNTDITEFKKIKSSDLKKNWN